MDFLLTARTHFIFRCALLRPPPMKYDVPMSPDPEKPSSDGPPGHKPSPVRRFANAKSIVRIAVYVVVIVLVAVLLKTVHC